MRSSAPWPGYPGFSCKSERPGRIAEKAFQGLDQISLVPGPCQLPDGVHAELGDADVHSPDTEPCSRDRANGGTATHVRADYHTLARDLRMTANRLENRFSFAIGGVALVIVDLDDRPLVDQRLMRRFV